MGVPKFYRWISERYPKINQVITDMALLPEFDHLYLDMNGVIHGCTHPNDLDVSNVLSEKDMMLGIMHYLDKIITQIVKPKVSVFMAIDGVAPRAKLNQQRSRRFRSARDMAEATKDDTKFSQVTNDDGSSSTTGVFDSNCITPGTEFMDRVSNCIKYMIRKKIKEDPLWRNLKIIFSGHEIPGEGEHKIMQHIRDMRSEPGYQPNTRHCMYGQDADLIMLGLISHEPHFTLLREIVDFSGGFSRNDNALKTVLKFSKQSDFQLLHLSILREYLVIEFAYGLDPSSYDFELIIDDFVFLTFLVGNDFLPHMPSLEIGDGAFDLLFETYRTHRKTWGEGEYLTKCGEITNAARLEAFLEDIGAAETEVFEKREESEAIYTKKKRNWDKRDGRPAGPSDAEIAAKEKGKQGDYVSMVEGTLVKIRAGEKFVDGWKPPLNPEEKNFKGRYYYEKLHFTPLHIDEHLQLRKSYVEGLIWCLAYYYRGCISWGWFYPYHYGPMLSDLTSLPEVFSSIKFEIGSPLKPFQQLMGCLPPASAAIVPRPYRKLMCLPDSPIAEFYPKEFEVDMNGKTNPWEGVNILPFIDGDLLKNTIAKHCPDKLLTADERRRNSPGKVFCYTHDPTANETIPSFNRDIGISDITRCNSRIEVIEGSIDVSNSFKPELIPGTILPLPGFPSLNVLPIVSAEIAPVGLNCFGFASKYPNTVLTLQTLTQLPDAAQLADAIIGKSLFINWPMMHEAKVVAVSDAKQIVRGVKKKKKIRKFNDLEARKWSEESRSVTEKYLKGSGVPGSGGVIIGDVQIRLKLVPLQGMKTSSVNGSRKKIFGTEEADVPLQMVLWKSPAPDPRFEERGPLTLKDRYPPRCNVILTKGKYRGCSGTVLNVFDDGKIGVKVNAVQPEPPFGLAIARSVTESYVSLSDAAKVLKMNPMILGKVISSIYFNPGRYDLGLNLKYKQDLCVLGYTRSREKSKRRNDTKNEKKQAWGCADTLLVVGNKRPGVDDDVRKTSVYWELTPKTVRLVAAFRQKFPAFFSAISKYPKEYNYDASILGRDGKEQLSKIREWLNNIETAKMPRSPCSTQAMPQSAMAAVQRAADVRVAAHSEEMVKESNVKVPSSALYRECSTTATDIFRPSDDSPELGDRIVNLCANGVPFGSRGTVVGIHSVTSGCVEVIMDEEFIGGGTLQGSCANFRGKLCVWNHLLKVSASNSMDIVEQMIPTGSGKVAINNILLAEKGKSIAVKNNNSPLRGNTPKKNSTGSGDAQIIQTLKSPASASRGGRQGTWREANGPTKIGIGFKGAGRGGKSGLQCWRQMLLGKGPIIAVRPTLNSKENQIDVASTTGLKAMLGVSDSSDDINPPQISDASMGLKSILGVSPMPPPPLVTPPLPPQRTTAADALLQMMAHAPTQATPLVIPQSSHPAFNFTYVAEGEGPNPPPPMPSQVQHQHPPYIQHPSMCGMPPMGPVSMANMNMADPNLCYNMPLANASIPTNGNTQESGTGASLPVPSPVTKSKK